MRYYKLKYILFSIAAIVISFQLQHQSSPFCQTWLHNGPPGDYVTTIEVAKYDSSVIFIGTQRNGVFRCNVNDWNWNPCNEGLPTDSSGLRFNNPNYYGIYWYGEYAMINTITTHQDRPGKVWIGMDNHGLFVSEDEGESWRGAESGIPEDRECRKIIVHETNPDVVLATIYILSYHLFRSVDGGLNWTDQGLGAFSSLEAVPGNPDHFYSVLYHSLDAGLTWIAPHWGGENGIWLNIAINPTDSTDMWSVMTDMLMVDFLAHTTMMTPEYTRWSRVNYYNTFLSDFHFDYQGNVYFNNDRSLDNGETWETLPWIHGFNGFQSFSITINDMLTLSNDSLIWALSRGVAFSDDFAETITWVDDALTNAYIKTIVPLRDTPGAYWVVSEQGLFHKPDYENDWQMITPREFYSIAVAPSNPQIILIGGDQNSVWRSENGGVTWNSIPGNYEGYMQFHPDNEYIIWRLYMGGIYRSEDDGETWELLHTGAYNRLEIDPIRPNRIFLGGEIFVRSLDNGETWETFQPPDNIYNIVSGFVNPELLYYNSLNNVYRSEDAGETWEVVGDDIPQIYEDSFWQLERSPYGEEALYLVARDQGVYHWLGPGH